MKNKQKDCIKFTNVDYTKFTNEVLTASINALVENRDMFMYRANKFSTKWRMAAIALRKIKDIAVERNQIDIVGIVDETLKKFDKVNAKYKEVLK